MKISGIYKLTSPSGKIYIGQSKDVHVRWADHKRSIFGKAFKCPKLSCAIAKYGWDNFEKEIIEECCSSLLDERESYWIMFHNSMLLGYNCNLGGKRASPSIETKDKIRESLIGRYFGSQNIEFFIDGNLYSSIGEASKKLLIPSKTIHNRLNSKNLKFENYQYKDKSKIPIRKKASKGKSKPFFAEGKLFNSLNEAKKSLNLSVRAIRNRIMSNNFSSYFYRENASIE